MPQPSPTLPTPLALSAADLSARDAIGVAVVVLLALLVVIAAVRLAR